MANFNKEVNPTSSDNISAGFATGDTWFNIITYDRYVHESNGVWKWTKKGSGALYTPNDSSKKMN